MQGREGKGGDGGQEDRFRKKQEKKCAHRRMRKAVSKQVRVETDGETCAEGSAILAEAALSWRTREEVRGGGVGGSFASTTSTLPCGTGRPVSDPIGDA